MEERVQKIISEWGIASRRRAEAMILAGRVRCNGVVAKLGQKADPETDMITVDGKHIQASDRPKLIYLLLNKPAGVVSTCHDPQGRTTVIDLLSPQLRTRQGIHPVGRLDVDSTGALLLTNDGNLTLALTHPRHSIPKTYHVCLEGQPPPSVLQQWRQGIILAGRKTRPAGVRVISQTTCLTCLEIILKEGRNRQIRRIAQQLGYPVLKLHRTAIGTIDLQAGKGEFLPEGSSRPLTDQELRFLQNQINSIPVQKPATAKRLA